MINKAAEILTSHSLSLEAGRISVDYAGFLSRHDIVYNSPIANPEDALPVGNGMMGAMIWNENGIMMQLTNVDASPHTGMSQGIINLYTDPPMENTGGQMSHRLILHDGIGRTEYGHKIRLTYFGDPDSELMGIHVEDCRKEVKEVTLDLGIWPISTDDIKSIYNRPELKYSDSIPNPDTWANPEFESKGLIASISRGLEDPNNFGYTLAVSVQDSSFTIKEAFDGRIRFSIVPSEKYTIWIACPGRFGARNHDSKSLAKALIEKAMADGSEKIISRCRNWWNDFWTRSFIEYSDGSSETDYIENSWYLSLYLIAAGCRGNLPIHFINGVWKSNRRDKSRWSWDYTYFNQRCVFAGFLTSNHLELMKPYFDLFIRNLESFREYTRSRFKMEGIFIHERYTWDGRVLDGNRHTDKIFTSGPELALMMYDYCRYTGDSVFLAKFAYPLVRDTAIFYKSYLKWDGSHYFIDDANSHETYWRVRNPITDLAMIRVLFPLAISLSEKFNADPEHRESWRNILSHLSPMPQESKEVAGLEKYLDCWRWQKHGRKELMDSYPGLRFMPHDPPYQEPNNVENVELEAIWPYGLIGTGTNGYDTALNTYRTRIFGYNIWETSSIVAARLGLGNDAYEHMRNMILRNQRRANGLHDDGNGLLESNGLHIIAMNESLLQSHGALIRVFPAVPDIPGFSARFTLLAAGSLLVSSELEGGTVKYVSIKSLHGNIVELANPWKGEFQVRKASDNSIVCRGRNEVISFATEADAIYLVEKFDSPLSKFKFKKISGAPSQDAKSLGCRTLGYHVSNKK